MHDRVTILRNGQMHEAGRYLRNEGGRTYQTVFYRRATRCDPTGYARFASDDPAMNAAAGKMIADMVDEAAEVQRDRKPRESERVASRASLDGWENEGGPAAHAPRKKIA